MPSHSTTAAPSSTRKKSRAASQRRIATSPARHPLLARPAGDAIEVRVVEAAEQRNPLELLPSDGGFAEPAIVRRSRRASAGAAARPGIVRGLAASEEVERALDVLGSARVIHRAEPDRVAAAQLRGGHEAVPARLERGHQTLVERRHVSCSLAPSVAAPAEADDPERRGRHQLELRRRLDHLLGVLGEVERSVDRLAERVDAEVADREPDLQRAAGAAQLDAEVREVDLVLVPACVAQVVGHDLEGAAQVPAVADEQRAALDTADRATCAGRASPSRPARGRRGARGPGR